MGDPQQPAPEVGTSSDPATRELGGPEASRLKQQVRDGDFAGMRQFLARSRQERDWQDRWFLLNVVAPSVAPGPLITAGAAEPDAADLPLLLGAYCFHAMVESRGAKVAEQTSEEQFRNTHQRLQQMMGCLHRVYPLDAEDPTPHVFAVRGLAAFSDYEDSVKQEYAEAVRLAPESVPTHYTMISARAKKWGGSHEESLHIARAAMAGRGNGDDMPVCLFLAHFFVWQYARVFDKNKEKADRYLKDRAVSQELNQALDRWLGEDYRPRRSSVPYLHQAALWYYLCGDNVRLKRVLAPTEYVPYDPAWSQIGDPFKTYSAALQRAATAQEKKPGFLGLFKR